MSRIDTNELSNVLNYLNRLRTELASPLVVAEKAAIELIESQELDGKAWQNTKQYFSVYPTVIQGVWNCLGKLINILNQYITAFETEVGNANKRLDTDELQELQNRLNFLNKRKQEMLQQFNSIPFSRFFNNPIPQQINKIQMDNLHKRVEILIKYREFELAHANDFEEITRLFILLNEGLTEMALQKGVGNPKFGYAPKNYEEAAWLKPVEEVNKKQPTYELIEYTDGTTQHYEIYRNMVFDQELSMKYQELIQDKNIRELALTGKELFIIDPDYIPLGMNIVTGEAIHFEEWLKTGFWLALRALSTKQIIQIAKNIKGNRKILDGVELTKKELKLFRQGESLGDYKMIVENRETDSVAERDQDSSL